MHETSSSIDPIKLSGNLTIQNTCEIHKIVCNAFKNKVVTSEGGVSFDLRGVVEVDLSFVQIYLAACRRASQESMLLVFLVDKEGEFLSVLARLGLSPQFIQEAA